MAFYQFTRLGSAKGVSDLTEGQHSKKFTQNSKIRFYQAGTSEMFGSSPPPQKENTPFKPRSPYAISKLAAHWSTINYRESFKLFACNGILFNHESPKRGETFVTQKIVQGLINIKKGNKKKMYVGNIYAKRDWGHAEDYVEAMWLMLQQKFPKDYIIATGNQISVKQFIGLVSKKLSMKINWKGKGLNEKAYFQNRPIIEIDPRYFRPSEVESLKGDPRKSIKELKWKPKHTISTLIDDMINSYL